ncbi:molybdopterin converting factor subunit 1 [Persephonella sp.]
MKVKVLYFSSLKDKLKRSTETMEIPEGINVEMFLKHLTDKHPEIKESVSSVMVAVNEEYASKDKTLKEGDIIALIPPVSGG